MAARTRDLPPQRGYKPQSQSDNPRKRPADDQEQAWVADEDRFVLQQAKKKAKLRVQAGRSKAIDLLAVTLHALDETHGGFESDDEGQEPLLVNPETVFDGLSEEELVGLEEGIDTYLALERTKSNREFWTTMKLICNDRRHASQASQSGRGVSSILSDLDRILAPKSLKELEVLESHVRQKLRTQADIDVEYWESLLKRASVHKARAQLRKVSQSIVEARLKDLRRSQANAAEDLRTDVATVLGTAAERQSTANSTDLDPDPLLRLSQADKALRTVDSKDFNANMLQQRQKVLKTGYFPTLKTSSGGAPNSRALQLQNGQGRLNAMPADDLSRTTSVMYEREAARGVGENEEVFAAEEELSTQKDPSWADQYRPRKPRHFNRVQTGYEWNKYNQTHYDHDNPPPKVVQGYRFNIFYPDLIDKTKAPTYRIERENGRRRGETLAPAGEEDSCLIRFVAGPPYQDIAFRIVDKEWDYSAKRERGFRSSFDKGILQLHFQFKKIFYRK